MLGMQMFNALRTLRSGSSFLLSAAAQQLRLRKREQQQQQQHNQQLHQAQQQAHPQHLRSPSRLGPRPDFHTNGHISHAAAEQHQLTFQQQQHQQQLPQGWQNEPSSFAAVGTQVGDTAFRVWDPSLQQRQRQQQQQQEWALLLDFMSAFAVQDDFMWELDGAVGSTPGRLQDAGSQRVPAYGLREPQLTLSYLQQPAMSQQQLQQQWRQHLAAAGAFGRGRPSAMQSGAGPKALDDQVTCSLGHLKLVLGPHSISMALQLATSILAAASAGRAQQAPSVSTAAAAPQAARSELHAGRASNSSSSRPGGLTMRLQLSVCHLAMNMERMVTADRLRGTAKGSVGRSSRLNSSLPPLQVLETKGLLSLLLLDVNSHIQRHASSPDEASDAAEARSGGSGSSGAGVGAAAGSRQEAGMQVTCSIAHVGLQDLCAPLEQRHVLSGAREPYEVSHSMRCVHCPA
jgi:hypothetical protein